MVLDLECTRQLARPGSTSSDRPGRADRAEETVGRHSGCVTILPPSLLDISTNYFSITRISRVIQMNIVISDQKSKEKKGQSNAIFLLRAYLTCRVLRVSMAPTGLVPLPYLTIIALQCRPRSLPTPPLIVP